MFPGYIYRRPKDKKTQKYLGDRIEGFSSALGKLVSVLHIVNDTKLHTTHLNEGTDHADVSHQKYAKPYIPSQQNNQEEVDPRDLPWYLRD